LIRPGPRADPRAFLNGESREAENFTQRQRSATQPGTGPNRTAAERGRGKKEDSWNVLKEEGWGFWRRTGSGPSRDVSPEMGIWDKDPIRTDAGRGTPIMCRGAMSGIKHSIRPHGPFRAWSIGFRWGDRAFIEGGARPVLPHRCSSAMRVVKGSDRTTRTDGRTGNPDRIHATTRGMGVGISWKEDQKKKEDKNRGATGM